MTSGSARATTCAPCAAAWSDDVSCCSYTGVGDALPSRFQLSGRSAASDMSVMSAMRSSEISPMAGDELEAGAGVVAHRAGEGEELVGLRGARRHRRAVAVGVRLAERRREPERAGCAATRAAVATIAAICSGVGGVVVASSPMTTRRMVEWPTWKPAFTARRPSMRSSHSPNDCQSHAGPASSESGACPRPAPSSASRSRRASGASGAMEKPQLPPITVVTPCSGDGVSAGSQSACTS